MSQNGKLEVVLDITDWKHEAMANETIIGSQQAIEERLAILWPYIKPEASWLAADVNGAKDGFVWYCYIDKPITSNKFYCTWETASNEKPDGFPMLGLHITIPDGLEWHDLIFERPK